MIVQIKPGDYWQVEDGALVRVIRQQADGSGWLADKLTADGTFVSEVGVLSTMFKRKLAGFELRQLASDVLKRRMETFFRCS